MRDVIERTRRSRGWLSLAVGCLALIAAQAMPSSAQTSRAALAGPGDASHKSHMRVPAGGPYPVRRKVTIGLDKSMLVEVPIDLQNVLVSNPEVLDAVVQASRQVYLMAKDVGEANAFFIGPDGQKVLFLEVTVARDLSALVDSLHRLLPGSNIRAEMVGDSVVLSGSVVSPIDANRAAELAARFVKKKENVVSMLSTASKQQVLLKVTVAEMQREALRRLGVDVPGAILNYKEINFAKVIHNTFPITSSVVPGAVATAVGVPPNVIGGSALQGSWVHGNQSVTGMVQAMERAGLLRLLAEPNLTAMSGETAKFLAGGEFPIPVAQDQNRITVEWKPFGVSVTFKPVVMSEGKISLAIMAEVSEIAVDSGITLPQISLPGLKVRRAETTLELPSGGTLAMAGLLSDDTRQNIEGLPGLKNLPILGALFRSTDYKRKESELVILVTPYIATHAPKQDMARPDDGFMPQSELKDLFFGHINRVYGRPSHVPSHRYHGDYGYIIEYPDPGVKG